MEKINLVYLHGFGSNGNSYKTSALKQNFDSRDFNIISPTLPVNPAEAVSAITNLLSNKGNYILIGTSLGGFYADYFNKLADIPCVLINPLIDIEPMQRHIGKNENYNTGQPFLYTEKDYNDLEKLKAKKESMGYSDSPEYILVAKDDELCDYKIAVKTFIHDSHWLQVVPKGGHRFTDTDKVLETVEELITDLNGHDFSSLYNDKVYESRNHRLNERYINILDKPTKLEYIDQIEKLIDTTYEYIGGFNGNIQDFLNDNYFWKLVRKEGRIVAGRIYKDKLGRKSVCAFTDGTPLGKIGLKTVIAEDLKLSRSWVEASGKMENLYIYSMKATPLPHSVVKIIMELMNKEVIDWDPDGYHYTRLIKGHPHTKAIFGATT